MKNYFELLEENKKFFERAFETAEEIATKAGKIFKNCKVYIVGSFAKKTYVLSSDLDILIISNEIPEKMDFEWYYKIVKYLTDDHRVNIHLLNEKRFKKCKKMYSPLIKIK
ncbi:MAG: nucleotidyltransferase domain-containing protein [Thermoprotei archaeon]|nr:MAG: nucleotidyltransferase domain-containing protein [Thermoprotei archaeon]